MSEQNLTGVWNGLYTYPGGRSVSFVATLIDSGGAFTGTTHEPNAFGGTGPLCATVSGSLAASSVSFVKAYDGADTRFQHTVDYRGTLSPDGTEIEGRWIIRSEWTGTFLMVREGGQKETAKRKEAVRA